MYGKLRDAIYCGPVYRGNNRIYNSINLLIFYQDDFERVWEDVLNNSGAPDWSAVDAQQWRVWFEFYKANSKVRRGACLRSYY